MSDTISPSRVQRKVLLFLDDLPEGGWTVREMIPCANDSTTRALIRRGLIQCHSRQWSITDMGRLVALGIRHEGANGILKRLDAIEKRLEELEQAAESGKKGG